MFKVPDWESDIPSPKVVFAKRVNTKKDATSKTAINLAVPSGIKKEKQKLKKSKVRVSPLMSTSTVTNNSKLPLANFPKSPKLPEKRKHNDNENDDMEINAMLLNAEKVKWLKEFQEIDREDLLFSEAKNKQNNKSSLNNRKKLQQKEEPITNDSQNYKKVAKETKARNIIVNEVAISGTSKKKTKLKDSDTENTSSLPEIRSKVDRKKEIIKKMLTDNQRRSINGGSYSNKLRQRMLERLKGAQFRYLNEKLYTSSGAEAKQMFESDPAAFKMYHEGYQQQVKKWPINPLDVIVKKVLKMPKSHVIADMGCGEAALSRRVPHTVHSLDLVAVTPVVTRCDMRHTPLVAANCDAAVYCLALMGTQLTDYLIEANRVLKKGGQLLIAEVESRFDDINEFTRSVERLGFKLKSIDKQHSVFFFLDFVKVGDPPVKKAKLPAIQLKPCLYKKR